MTKAWLEAKIARIWCRTCARVRSEAVPWARPDARHSRDFEDIVAWLAQRTDKTSLSGLMRCSWEAVHRIVGRVVVEHPDPSRLDDLYQIGVDEISYKRGHRYLTVVTDHDGKGVIWVKERRSVKMMEQFHTELGPDRCSRLDAVIMDGAPAYIGATHNKAPNATICFERPSRVSPRRAAVDGRGRRQHSRPATSSSIASSPWRCSDATGQAGTVPAVYR